MHETQVPSLGWEDPLEQGMAAQSSILAWRVPCAEEPGRLQSVESQRVGHNRATGTYTFSESTPSHISWQTKDLSALKLDVSSGFCLPFLIANVLVSLVCHSASLELAKWMRPQRSGSPWLWRKENGFLATSVLEVRH